MIVTLLQGQFLPGLLPGAGAFLPDLNLLLAMSWALLLDWPLSLPLAFAVGLTYDLFNPTLLPLGTNALLMVVLALAVSLQRRDNLPANVTRAAIVVFPAALVYRGSLLLGLTWLGYNRLQLENLVNIVIPGALIDATLMLLIYVLVRRISSIGGGKE